MTQRLCPRCHAALRYEDEGSLVFCWNCGAPQVRLSEDLLAQAERQRTGLLAPEEPVEASPAPDPSAVLWKSMIRIAAAVCGFFVLPSMFLPPMSLLAPAVVLALYASRFRHVRIGSALGARVGLVCGLFMALGISFMSTIGMLLSRFATHQMSDFDSRFDAIIVHTKAQVAAQQGADAAQIFNLNVFFIPEFRAGLILTFFVGFMFLLILLVTASGAFAGFIRSRTQTR